MSHPAIAYSLYPWWTWEPWVIPPDIQLMSIEWLTAEFIENLNESEETAPPHPPKNGIEIFYL